MIRLIALDFDYTLIDYQEGLKPRIEPEALALLNRLCERGVKAGIVTGRAFDGFAATLADVGGDWRAPFPAYMIASDSFIYQKDAICKALASHETADPQEQQMLSDILEAVNGEDF